MAEFPSEDNAAVSVAASGAALASATLVEDENSPRRRPNDENAPEVLFDV